MTNEEPKFYYLSFDEVQLIGPMKDLEFLIKVLDEINTRYILFPVYENQYEIEGDSMVVLRGYNIRKKMLVIMNPGYDPKKYDDDVWEEVYRPFHDNTWILTA